MRRCRIICAICLYTGNKTLAQRNDDVVHFLAAEMTALRFALANRDKTIALAKEVSEAKADDPRAAYIFDEVTRYIVDHAATCRCRSTSSTGCRSCWSRTGNLAKPFDLKTMVDTGAREKALALAGK